MRKIVFFFLILVFIFSACKDVESPATPEIKPRAVLEITMQYEPVVFHYNVLSDSWCCTNSIIITETNGVGGYINSAKLELIYNNQAYESKSYEGKQFVPHESWSVSDVICTIYEYEKIKITIAGEDNNGYTIEVSKYFDVSYQ